jgi:hypothetical protein
LNSFFRKLIGTENAAPLKGFCQRGARLLPKHAGGLRRRQRASSPSRGVALGASAGLSSSNQLRHRRRGESQPRGNRSRRQGLMRDLRDRRATEGLASLPPRCALRPGALPDPLSSIFAVKLRSFPSIVPLSAEIRERVSAKPPCVGGRASEFSRTLRLAKERFIRDRRARAWRQLGKN